jgi:hypothetical protein
MPPTAADKHLWVSLAADQHGLIARGQLLAAGLTRSEARRHVRSGRWQPVLPGVYATFTGALDHRTAVWAAVLYAGPGAVAGFRTALWLSGVLDDPPSVVEVCIPESRRVRAQPGLRVTRTRRLPAAAHPAAQPPRLRLEEALLDATDRTADLGPVLDLLFRATQRRLTTADRLSEALARRPRHRWRRLIGEALADVADGAASPLERRYLTDVERPHALPQAVRNRPERPVPGGPSEYRDVDYPAWRTVVELDGRRAHPEDRAFRDHRRDNRAAVGGRTTLRYGWHDVAGDPCAVAAQVGAVLRRNGWGGQIQACGPQCRAPGLMAA